MRDCRPIAVNLRARRAQLDRVFFFNATATTEIYTLSLHDALPIFPHGEDQRLAVASGDGQRPAVADREVGRRHGATAQRSEEHTSELQSRQYLVCRLLLEKKTREARYRVALCGNQAYRTSQ